LAGIVLAQPRAVQGDSAKKRRNASECTGMSSDPAGTFGVSTSDPSL
jgi:hypothetical protein